MQESRAPQSCAPRPPELSDSCRSTAVDPSGRGGPQHLGRLIRRAIVAAAGALWIAVSVYVLYADIWQSRNPPPPPLSVDAASLDFGSTWNSEEFEWRVPIQNSSAFPVKVDRLEGSCTCTLVSPSAFVLRPGEQVNVKLKYNLFSRTRRDGLVPIVPFDDRLDAFVLGDERPLASWHVRGLVKNAFFWKPRELDFGDTLVEGQPYPTRLIDVTCYEPCKGFQVSLDSKDLAAIAKNPSGDGLHFQVAVAPRATLESGVHKFKLALGAVRESGERLPGLSVPVEARIRPDLQILPLLAHFGDLKQGESGEETITLASRAGRAFEVAGFDCSSKNVNVVPLAPKQPGTKVFRVRMKSSKPGAEDSEVRFKIRYLSQTDSAAPHLAETAVFDVRCFGVR
jgi:hypothetical protein